MKYGDERFPLLIWKKVYPEPNTGCWLWGGGQNGVGYPSYNGKWNVHRQFLKVETRRTPPASVFACHTCDTPQCVNPDHLYWGDAKTNADDRNTRHGHPNSLKTHCPEDHELVEGNLVPWKFSKGIRECLTCSRNHKRAWKARNR